MTMTMSKRRMGGFVLLYGAAALIVACQRETIAPPTATQTTSTAAPVVDASTVDTAAAIPLIPDVLTRSVLGTEPGGGEASSFQKGQKIYLTLWIKEAPEGLVVSARWLDDDGKQLSLVHKPANGAKVVSVPLERKLGPGQYRVEGIWGGNKVVEKSFAIR
jgi:hypothetical protein